MSALETDIKRVNEKLQQLLKRYAVLQSDNEKLNSSLKELKLEKTNQSQQIEQLQLQTTILKSAAGQLLETDKKLFEKNINQYIKEIDKCIALLSQ